MSNIGGKHNDNIQLFSREQISRIFGELKITPALHSPLKTAAKPQPVPAQSVEDILKNNFIDEEQSA